MNTESVASGTASLEISRRSDPAPARRLTGLEPRARILYVDDEPQLRRLGEIILARSGFDVDTAADGAAAWASLKEVSYNLLITDNDMPRLTGLELAAEVRRAGMRLPIMLTSGSPSFLEDPAYLRLELAAFLAKPFAPSLLVETVEQVLLSANDPRARAQVGVSALARLAKSIQPRRHGGINE